MTNRVDVHVLHCYEPKEWVDGCLNSMVNEPVNVFLCEGIKGKVGLARANAFRKGNAEYVSFVDADDEVMPGAFAAALEVLDSRPDVVATYCDLHLIGAPDNAGCIKGEWSPLKQLLCSSEVLHLHVMRRSAVEKCLDELEKWDGYEEYVLMGLLCQYGIQYHIPQQLYRFRQHSSYPRAGLIGGKAMNLEATTRIMPIMLKHIYGDRGLYGC